MAGVGRIGLAARRFVREHPNLSGVGRITAELAVATGDMADAARRAGDARSFLVAAKQLGELLGALEPKVAGGEPGSGDGGAGPGGVGPADQLEELLGAGPAVGD